MRGLIAAFAGLALAWFTAAAAASPHAASPKAAPPKAAAPTYPPMSFSLSRGLPGCDGCLVIAAEGEIMADTPAALQRVLKANHLGFVDLDRKSVTVVLDSPGGSVVGGVELGRLFRSEYLNTHVAKVVYAADGRPALGAGICASSCAYAFLGGRQRSVGEGSRYGLHQVSTPSRSAVRLDQAVGFTQELIAVLARYVEAMGVSPEVVTLATRTSSSGIDWIDHQKLVELKVVNASGPAAAPPWTVMSPRVRNEWVVFPIEPDGVQAAFGLLCQKGYGRGALDGHLLFDFTTYTPIPPDSIYKSALRTLTLEVARGQEEVVDLKAKVLEDDRSFGLWDAQMPVGLLRRAAAGGPPLTVRVIDAPDELKPLYGVPFPVPTGDLDKALTALEVFCPDLKGAD